MSVGGMCATNFAIFDTWALTLIADESIFSLGCCAAHRGRSFSKQKRLGVLRAASGASPVTVEPPARGDRVGHLARGR